MPARAVIFYLTYQYVFIFYHTKFAQTKRKLNRRRYRLGFRLH